MKVWLNGRLVAPEQATISVLDRGFLFGDGVYELVRFFGGVGVGMAAHLARLRASLAQSRIEGFAAEELPRICTALLESAGLADGSVYIQVTRGAGATRHHVPSPELRPTVFASAAALPPLDALRGPDGLRAILQEDRRWQRCSIKTTSLMGNILALMDADDADADEA
ncbi:MAG: aminotransferase class IV, partial [Phycisphaerales bacterium]|nr:aminotransferase class IV [Phycisphaerales bacterium]